MDSEILKSILKETRETGLMVARIDERVKVLYERADAHDANDADHAGRIAKLEEPAKYRKWLFAVVVAVGTIAGAAKAVGVLF